MSSVPGRKDGDGKRPADPPRTSQPQPPPQPQAPPIQPQAILVSRVLEVGPPLVPRQQPPAPAAPSAHAKTATSSLGAMPNIPPPAPLPKSPAKAPAKGPPPARPAAPDVMGNPPPSGGESLWDSVEALLDDVDAGFDAVIDTSPNTTREAQKGPSRSPSGGLSNARELFGQLATAHVRHVRDFMLDVKSGQATTEWLPLCEPAVRSVRKMAEQLELRELCTALDAYLATLRVVGEICGFSIDGEGREKLIAAYEPLIAAMPTAFSLDAVKSKREGIIVQSLLMQVGDVKKVTIDKLYAAGLTSLDAFFMARPDEIAMTTGLDVGLATRISDRFRHFKQEMQQAAIDDSRTYEHTRLRELCVNLSRQHQAFEQAEKEDEGTKKREMRKAREGTLLEIRVLLARLGEIDRVAIIDKVPYAQKVGELSKYLEEAQNRPKG